MEATEEGKQLPASPALRIGWRAAVNRAGVVQVMHG